MKTKINVKKIIGYTGLGLWIVAIIFGVLLVFSDVKYCNELGFYCTAHRSWTVGEAIEGIIHYEYTHMDVFEIIEHVLHF